jgi:hypothetical protein
MLVTLISRQQAVPGVNWIVVSAIALAGASRGGDGAGW